MSKCVRKEASSGRTVGANKGWWTNGSAKERRRLCASIFVSTILLVIDEDIFLKCLWRGKEKANVKRTGRDTYGGRTKTQSVEKVP